MPEQIIVKLDSQILESMNLCPEKYRLQFMEHWRPNKTPEPLERGIMHHKMLAHYYSNRMRGRTKPHQQFDLVQECLEIGQKFVVEAESLSNDDFTLIDAPAFKEYILRWQYDGWEVIAVEQPFSKTLFESEMLKIDYEGIIDLLINDPKLGRCIVDTKTEARRYDILPLNNQMQGYEWASNGLPVIINKIGLQKHAKKGEDEEGQKVDNRFRRTLHHSGEAAIKEWREDVVKSVIEAIGWHKDIDKGRRLKKNRSSCDKYGGCQYFAVCKDPEVGENKLIAYFYKDKPWDVFTRDVDADVDVVTDAADVA